MYSLNFETSNSPVVNLIKCWTNFFTVYHILTKKYIELGLQFDFMIYVANSIYLTRLERTVHVIKLRLD